jgi:hypothetical protein
MVASFHSLDLVDNESTKLAGELQDLTRDGTNIGVEFIRKYNRAAIAWVILTPPLGSLIFAIIWMAIYLRDPEDIQAKITTAFTVSTYLVTAGM